MRDCCSDQLASVSVLSRRSLSQLETSAATRKCPESVRPPAGMKPRWKAYYEWTSIRRRGDSVMDRRAFFTLVAGICLLDPLAVRAQQAGKARAKGGALVVVSDPMSFRHRVHIIV